MLKLSNTYTIQYNNEKISSFYFMDQFNFFCTKQVKATINTSPNSCFSFCADLDECSALFLNNCTQQCTNVKGSFSCPCSHGFQRGSSNRICTPTGQFICLFLCDMANWHHPILLGINFLLEAHFQCQKYNLDACFH